MDDPLQYPQNMKIGLVPVDGGHHRWISTGLDRTFFAMTCAQAPVWESDETLLAAVEDRGDTHLVRLGVNGRDPEPVTSGRLSVLGFDEAGGVDRDDPVDRPPRRRTVPVRRRRRRSPDHPRRRGPSRLGEVHRAVFRRQRRDRRLDHAIDTIYQMVPYAYDYGLEVIVGCEDASRADPDFLLQVAEAAQAAGACRIRYADTLGVMEPFGVHKSISALRRNCDIDIEMHAHDDLGLATANSLAAAVAGATHINTTVNGLGERAGNAPLEEVALGLKKLYAMNTGIDLAHFTTLSEIVAAASGRPVPWQKSVVGGGAFTHEAGIHVDGLLKDPNTYQGFDPVEVGRQHKLVVGKHSGAHGIIAAYATMGLHLSQVEARALLPDIRSFAEHAKRSPADQELLFLYQRYIGRTLPGMSH